MNLNKQSRNQVTGQDRIDELLALQTLHLIHRILHGESEIDPIISDFVFAIRYITRGEKV
ncbi:hypothetical protein ND864_17445 [Leptospira levettii]|uniref:hypothetical protein n=1 Tax=Leptospira levettii TaxID=2023178 RepID=UPI00223E6ADA|nr:hypothetical protein [Leptospira levettii]MCW7467508.1 hypothetical protein [Leptospira levettii]